jgi:hypothetical protein
MRITICCLLLLPSLLRAQVIEFTWPNQPCATVLNCDTGCTACNLPGVQGTTFMGNNAGFLGVDVCPHPVATADNALLTYGWPVNPDDAYAVLITGLAFTPTRIDSIVIRHRSGPDGPQRLQVRFGINQNMPAAVLADVPVLDAFGSSALAALGVVAPEPTMVYGYFSLLLQPYDGAGGSWDLDAVRIVGSPAATSVPDMGLPINARRMPRFDALGRPLDDQRTARLYIDGTRRIVVE